jgi:hypothetical protein
MATFCTALFGAAAVFMFSLVPIWLTRALGVLASGFFVLFGSMLLGSLRARNDRVRVYEDALTRERGGATLTLPWAKLELRSSITVHLGRGTRQVVHHHVLRGPDGQKLVLDEQVRDIDGLIARIEERLVRHQLGPILRAIDRGEAHAFGPLTIERAGLRDEASQLDWRDLGEIRVLAGELIIEDRSGDRRWAIAWRELVNAAVLLAALRFIRATDVFSARSDPWRDEHLESWLADYAL